MTSNDFVGLLFEEIKIELERGVEDAIGEAKEAIEAFQESFESATEARSCALEHCRRRRRRRARSTSL